MATWKNQRERRGAGGGAAVASTSSETAMIQYQQVEGEDSSSGQERPEMQADWKEQCSNVRTIQRL